MRSRRDSDDEAPRRARGASTWVAEDGEDGEDGEGGSDGAGGRGRWVGGEKMVQKRWGAGPASGHGAMVRLRLDGLELGNGEERGWRMEERGRRGTGSVGR
jgi:hypothetical protein